MCTELSWEENFYKCGNVNVSVPARAHVKIPKIHDNIKLIITIPCQLFCFSWHFMALKIRFTNYFNWLKFHLCRAVEAPWARKLWFPNERAYKSCGCFWRCSASIVQDARAESLSEFSMHAPTQLHWLQICIVQNCYLTRLRWEKC